MTTNIETIQQVESINIYADSKHELEELNTKMDYICKQNANEFYKLNMRMAYINSVFENNFNSRTMNTNFDDHELFEEQMDELIYEYNTVKELMKQGRQVKFYKEQKETEKKNELRYARNTMVQCGIEHFD